MKRNEKETKACTECNHVHYKNGNCTRCNCGESERIYTGSWRGYDPVAMYNGGEYSPYERSNRELNLYPD